MITKIDILPDDLQVHFSGENSEIFPNIWLRDHAKDEQNWDKRSSQRKTFTASLDLNLKIDKKEFFGGSMTITSLGGIGGSFFTPIINFPEVAILGIGRSYKKQVFIDGKFVPRTMLPLSLSYDHRIIDGAEAAKFNNELKENLGANFAYNLTK